MQKGAEGQHLTAEDKLFVLSQAWLYLTATRGLAAPEALKCYEQAEPSFAGSPFPSLFGANRSVAVFLPDR